MDFESPDVEKDFPGLYASESGKKSNDSDFSDEGHERLSKKDLIGKRKDKKESKKDRGYATLEGESSPEEETDIKSPSKIKILKPFKFPSAKKEKREKSREKDVKERDLEKEKKKDSEKDKDKKKDGEKDKEKKKEGKVKLKLKERKKSKHGDEETDNIGEERPIFGVPLALAVEWSRCHDGIDIPLIVRNCIDHIQHSGLKVDGLYKTSGIKSKVQQLQRLYNQREPVTLADYELSNTTSLLKQFLRELPEPILTTELLHRFEEAGAAKEVAARGAELKGLVEKLPRCNRLLLAWLVTHFDSVTEHEKLNKMNAQTLSMTLSPVMQVSQRLLSALLCHCSSIFPDTVLVKYVEPLHPASLSLPVMTEGLIDELRKQESFLGQIHSEMNAGFVTKRREEQLWEVQRFITQLKRKLRSLEKASSNQPSLEEVEGSPSSKPCEDNINSAMQPAQQPEMEPVLHQAIPSPSAAPMPIPAEPAQTVSLSPPPPSSTPPSARSPLLDPALPSQAMQPAPVALPTIPPLNIPKHSATKVGISEQGVEAVIEKDRSVTSLSMEMLPTASVFGSSTSEEGRDKLNPPSEEELTVRLEVEEWVSLARSLQSMIEKEKRAIADLRLQIYLLGGDPVVCRHRDSRGALAAVDREVETSLLVLGRASDDTPRLRKVALMLQEGNALQVEKMNLIKSIARERGACVDLRVKIKLQQMKKNNS